jgi:Phosphotransferase enzyme family
MEPMRPKDAAVTIGREFGLAVTEAVTLADSNNVVVWLTPSPVVARVGTGHHRSLSLELHVARHLVACRAPVFAPAPELPQVVHHLAGFDVTFWQYHADDRAEDVDPAKLAVALSQLHQALATYPGVLPSYEVELDEVGDVLHNHSRSAALDHCDRDVLLAALDRFRAELASYRADRHALHGSPHSNNVLVVGGAPRFIDFETACRGPIDWDLAHVGADVAAAYPSVSDDRVRASCAALVSVKTAAWCWTRVDHPDLRWHALHHLGVVKSLMRDRA